MGGLFSKKQKTYDLQALLGDRLLRKDGGKFVKAATCDALSPGQYVGLYFGSETVKFCREFTLKLRKTYLILSAQQQPLEVVFVSADDGDADAFRASYTPMPWLALPQDKESDRARRVRAALGVTTVPKLVIVGPIQEDGTTAPLVCRNGVQHVVTDGEGSSFPWSEPLQATCCCW